MISAAAVTLALVLAGLAVLAQHLWRRTGSGGKPIPSPFPLWSDMLITVIRTGNFPDTVKLHAQHGPIYWWRFLGRRVLMVGSYEAVRKVLRGEHTLVEADYPPSVRALLGPWGTVNIHGDQHLRIKRVALAAFTPKAVRGYLPRMQATAEEAAEKWAAQGDILVHREMKYYTFRVAVEVIVGFDASWVSPAGFPVVSKLFQDWLDGLFSLPLAIPGTAFARGLKARAALVQHIHQSLDLVLDRKAAGAATAGASKAAAKGSGRSEAARGGDGDGTGLDGSGGGGGGGDGVASFPTALDFLMAGRDEEGKALTRDQLTDNVLTMLFAGHDTSTTSLARIFQQLHGCPEAVQKLRQEQAAVVAKHGTAITEAALEDMPYADGVVREAMRITPIIAGFPRKALQDFELEGFHIPKGTRMQCSLRDPLLTDARWQDDDPLLFKPERWLNGAAQKPGAWIPFGGGSRLCLGWLLAMAEMKVLLAVVFRRYSLQLQEPQEPWQLFPLARPLHGMPARFVEAAAAAGGGD